MQTASTPANENERLKALRKYRILDTDFEKEYDDIVNLVSQICEAPIVLISLVDAERQWFKALKGLEASQTARNISFCSHAILQNDLFIVPDAFADARFADNPLVTEEPHVRFYAGKPLTTPEGFNIGVLCVIDSKPRELNETQKMTLEVLGNQIISLFEARIKLNEWAELQIAHEKYEEELVQIKEQLQSILHEIQDVVWSVALPTYETLFVSHSVEKLYGISVEEWLKDNLLWYKTIHPEDRQVVQKIIDSLKETGKSAMEYRIVCSDGTVKWIFNKSKYIFDENHIPLRLDGLTSDITELKRTQAMVLDSQKQIQSFFEISSDFMTIANQEGYFEIVNHTFQKELGYTEHELLSRTFFEFIHPEDLDATLREVAKLSEGKLTLDFENRYRHKNGEYIWLSWRTAPDPKTGALFATARNITEEKKERLRKENEAQKTKWYNAIISQLNSQDFEEFADMQEVFEFVNTVAAEGLQIHQSSIWFYNPEKTSLICQNFYEVQHSRHRKETFELNSADFSVYFEALANQIIIAANNVHIHPSTAQMVETHFEPLGIKSLLDVPIVSNGEILGILCNSGFNFREWINDDLSFAQTLADFITLSMHSLERKQARRDLEISRQTAERLLKDIRASISYALHIQDAIIPKESELQKYFDCFVLFHPKDVVSGDFYWFAKKQGLANSQKLSSNPYSLNPDIYILAVADCTGHGVSGAFMTMIGNNILNQIVNDYSITEPDEILNKMPVLLGRTLRNNEHRIDDGMDISIIVISQNPQGLDFTGLKISYAGAKNPLYCVQNQALRVIEADKVSIFSKNQEDFRYKKHELIFDVEFLMLNEKNQASKSQNSTLYLCSDGFRDQFGGEKDRKFMIGRFKKLLLEISDKPMHEQKNLLDDAFNRWKGTKEQTDDVLVLGIRV